MRVRTILAITLALGLSSCGKYDVRGMFVASGDGPDARFDKSMEWNRSQPLLRFAATDNEYRLYMFTDAHIYRDTYCLDKFTEAFLADADAVPAAVCLGDLVDRKDTYPLVTDHLNPILSASGKRFLCTPGNHDIFFGEWTEFVKHFHTGTFTAEIKTPSDGTDLYIFVDSASGTLGSSQRGWLGETLSDAQGYRNIIICTHTPLFSGDNIKELLGNYPMEETYDLAGLISDHGVTAAICGHEHHWSDITFKNVRHIVLDALSLEADSPSYSIVTVGHHNLTFNSVCTKRP